MRRNVAWWGLAGLVVAVFWFAYVRWTAPFPMSGGMWTLAEITCPVALFARFPLKDYWVFLINTGTYALVGFGIELLRRRLGERAVH